MGMSRIRVLGEVGGAPCVCMLAAEGTDGYNAGSIGQQIVTQEQANSWNRR